MMTTQPPCKWLHKNRDYAWPLYCSYSRINPQKMKDDTYCLGCDLYQPDTIDCFYLRIYEHDVETNSKFLTWECTCSGIKNPCITDPNVYCKDCLRCKPINESPKEDNTVDSCEFYNQFSKLCIECKETKFCHWDVCGSQHRLDRARIANTHSNDTVNLKEQPSMKVCKYQDDKNDCTKSEHRKYTCVFARCNAWQAAEARCRYFEHTHEAELHDILKKIPEAPLTVLESMLKNNPEWTMKQISYSLSGRYDP